MMFYVGPYRNMGVAPSTFTLIAGNSRGIEPIFLHCHAGAQDYEQKMSGQIWLRHYITAAFLRKGRQTPSHLQNGNDLEGKNAVRYWCHKFSQLFSVHLLRNTLHKPRASFW